MKETGRQRKNVLFLTRWYPDRSDPQNAVFIRKHALAAAKVANIAVIYVAPSRIEAGMKIEKREGGPFQLWEISLHFPPSSLPLVGKLLNLWQYSRGLWSCWKSLKKKGFQVDLVHAHMMTRQVLFAWFLKLRFSLPYLITEHWTGYRSGHFRKFPAWKKKMMKWLFRNALCITVVSPALREAMEKEGVQGRFVILPNVVDPPPEKGKPFFGQEARTLRIGSVADFFDRKKNVSGMLQGLAPLLKSRPELSFHLIGDGPDRPLIEAEIRKLGLSEDQLVLYGRLPNEAVLQFMKEIDLYICFSNVETFSVATAEALAAGKPVICTASGGPEYFVDDRCGRVIPVGDQQALAQSVEILLGADSPFDSQYASQRIIDLFGAEAIGEQMGRLYNSLSPQESRKND